MPKQIIKIIKKDDKFVIDKNKNYEYFFSMSIIFYHKIIEVMKKDSGMNIEINPKFENLLTKLTINNETIIINEAEIKFLTDWVDCLCLIMLELDSIDFKNKDIKKFLRLSESLINNSKKLLKTP